MIEGFEMPIRASIGEQEQWFNLTTQWQPFELPEGELVWDNNFYIAQAFLAQQ